LPLSLCKAESGASAPTPPPCPTVHAPDESTASQAAVSTSHVAYLRASAADTLSPTDSQSRTAPVALHAAIMVLVIWWPNPGSWLPGEIALGSALALPLATPLPPCPCEAQPETLHRSPHRTWRAPEFFIGNIPNEQGPPFTPPVTMCCPTTPGGRAVAVANRFAGMPHPVCPYHQDT
jgi:hypothetical protein